MPNINKFNVPAMMLIVALTLLSSSAQAFSLPTWLGGSGGADPGKQVGGVGSIDAAAPVAVRADPDCKKKIDDGRSRLAKATQDENEKNVKKANWGCLDKYRNFSIGATLGFPTKEQLIAQLMGQMCSAVDQQIAPALGQATQGLPLPGGIGRVDMGAVFGGGHAGTGNVNIGGGGAGTSGNVLNPGGSGYTMPKIFK